jgi:hypothetical protein
MKKKSLEQQEQEKLRATDKYKNYYDSEERKEKLTQIRQKSLYNDDNRARIDNNQFFEERSNPLSSKGN